MLQKSGKAGHLPCQPKSARSGQGARFFHQHMQLSLLEIFETSIKRITSIGGKHQFNSYGFL